jgi:hypothetical protein
MVLVDLKHGNLVASRVDREEELVGMLRSVAPRCLTGQHQRSLRSKRVDAAAGA